MIDLERTMEIDPDDLDFLCWLFGCYDIEEDIEEEEEENEEDD